MLNDEKKVAPGNSISNLQSAVVFFRMCVGFLQRNYLDNTFLYRKCSSGKTYGTENNKSVHVAIKIVFFYFAPGSGYQTEVPGNF